MGPVSRQLRFGYKVSAEQFSPADLLEFTVVAEECGFDTAAISDHFQPWRHTGGHAPFSLAWLGVAGHATTRVSPRHSATPRRSSRRRWARSGLSSPAASGSGWELASR